MSVFQVELLGYFASAMVLLSFFMKNIKMLRTVNCFGCSLFVAYGIFLGSIPIIITNVAILMVNSYYLFIKDRSSKAKVENPS
ncbi:uroporphyrinogen decarboxylase [Nonlabens spongiae]|uniref:Uroporphyrinogen decarboxylase n=1 Tax=Nonlabens spongiae TaxID=331648 RepID=A0A1W6MGD7_9FLAO|nr:YgjV family protein [Nonlabens spongiae]ARN76576.1 uroporphyrinogen decarboxylase [Nonlabens spongiae]